MRCGGYGYVSIYLSLPTSLFFLPLNKLFCYTPVNVDFDSDGKMSIFRGVDRIKLLISIMEAKKYEGGAGLHLTNMLVKEAVLAGFPLHEYEELNMLQELWLVFFQQPQSQPVGE